MTNTKKAAPIWSRLSEQLTRCALCVCDPKHKHGDDSRYQAGGQCNQSGSVRCHTCNERFSLYSLRNCSRAKAHGANLSDSCSIFLRRLFRAGDNVLVNSLSVIVLSCIAMRRSYSHHGAGDGYSCSLALRRCSYFNLRPQASKTHEEKLALGLVNFSCSTLASIPSISSCGNRIFFFADLLFVFPLDIGTPHLNGFDGRTQYSKKSEKLSIDMCAHMILICAHSLGCIAQIKQRPAVLATHAGRLTTNDRKRIEVAMRNHTIHPQGRDSHNLNKYIWRFIALSTAQPRVITIEATSEQEARQQSPAGCVMVFAARIRQGETYAQ
ncbi:host cell division inhibitor Icd-like protein [Escherichia coli]|nr:host cell division inhibitor Icd-like protein [Escherichia coli]